MKRLNKCLFLGCFSSLLSPQDTSKVFGFLVMQDINKKEVFSHPFFLNLLGFVCKVCQLARVEKVLKSVQATKNLYPFFSVFLTDNDWQRSRTLDSLR
ncbi:MAG: hypothetical protein ACLT67_01040 [Streptococcus salivarius]